MAYQMGNPGDSSMEEMPADGSMHEMGDMDKKMGSLFLTPDMLPSGMKVDSGDILEFRVVGTDKDGDIEVTYNTGDKGEDQDTNYANDMKKEMSARNPDEGAM